LLSNRNVFKKTISSRFAKVSRLQLLPEAG